jgi:hypothetical protein
MGLMSSLRLKLRLFGHQTGGSMPTEGVMAFAFLIWWYIASFQFFDAFRQKNVTLKAAYTIADMISRETDPIDADYIAGLNTVFDYLTYSQHPTWIRVSSIYWDADDGQYRRNWSIASDPSKPVYTDATIDAQSARIPVMPEGDTVILVETFMAYEPIFSIGLAAGWYDTFITTRPRFVPCVRWDPGGGVTPSCVYSS